jgi:hypothetical protein
MRRKDAGSTFVCPRISTRATRIDMPSPSPHLIAACAALALQGCAIVGSERANSGGSGVGYMLPRALVPVELVHEGGGLELRLGTPVPVGDTDHTYALQRSGNVFTSDNVVITVDPATALLSSLDVKSEDESAAALVELVKGTIRRGLLA